MQPWIIANFIAHKDSRKVSSQSLFIKGKYLSLSKITLKDSAD